MNWLFAKYLRRRGTLSADVRKASFRPGLESLETRWCPSTTANLTNGVLWIVGNSGANVVSVTQDHGATDMTVKFDGQQKNFVPSDVQKIIVILKGGADDFTYQLGGGSDLDDPMALDVRLGRGADKAQFDLFHNGDPNGVATIKKNLTVVLGGGLGNDEVDVLFGAIDSAVVSFKGKLAAGNDVFTASFKGDLLGTAAATVELSGLPGKDELTTTASADAFNNDGTGIDIDAGASLAITLRGGYGVDTVTTTYQGVLHGQLNVINGGGPAGDTLTANLTAAAGSDGSVDASVHGKLGPDNLTLNLVDNSGGTLNIIQALIDGGPDNDTCTATPNVITVNCEQ